MIGYTTSRFGLLLSPVFITCQWNVFLNKDTRTRERDKIIYSANKKALTARQKNTRIEHTWLPTNDGEEQA